MNGLAGNFCKLEEGGPQLYESVLFKHFFSGSGGCSMLHRRRLLSPQSWCEALLRFVNDKFVYAIHPCVSEHRKNSTGVQLLTKKDS